MDNGQREYVSESNINIMLALDFVDGKRTLAETWNVGSPLSPGRSWSSSGYWTARNVSCSRICAHDAQKSDSRWTI